MDRKAYVIVDGQSMVNEEGLIAADSLDSDMLATEMRKLRIDERSVATFHLLPGHGPGDFQVLTWLLEGFDRNRCRYDHVYRRSSSDNYHEDAQDSIDWLRDTGASERAENLNVGGSDESGGNTICLCH